MIRIQRIEDDKFEIWLTDPFRLLGYWNASQVKEAQRYLGEVFAGDVKSSPWFMPAFQQCGEKWYPSGNRCEWPGCTHFALCTSDNVAGAFVCREHFSITNGKTNATVTPEEDGALQAMAATAVARQEKEKG